MFTDDLFAHDVLADPYTYYGRLRDSEPVYWNELLGVWLVTSYDDVVHVLRHPDKFSSEVFTRDTRPQMPPISDADSEAFEVVKDFFGRTMSAMDPPKHTVIRRALQGRFSRRAIERYRGMLEEEVSRLLASAAAQGPITNFVDEVAMPLPIIVIARIMGVPESSMPMIRQLAAQFHTITRSEPNRMQTIAAGVRGFEDLVGDLLDFRRSHPTDDLLSTLSELETSATLTREDTVANAALLLSAGHETTANLLTNSLITLSTRPEIWATLSDRDADYTASVVEECLRFDGPITSMLRIPVDDVKLGDKLIRAGDRVRWVIASANRDPKHFRNPDQFLPDRTGPSHLSFGNGIHFCLGIHLARLEAQVFMSTMSKQYPNYRLASDEIRYQASVFFRAAESLFVALE